MCLFHLVNTARKIKELLYIIYFDHEDVNYLNEYRVLVLSCLETAHTRSVFFLFIEVWS